MKTSLTKKFTHIYLGKYWYNLKKDDLHWNLSDNGWAKMAWSGVFGPWSQAAGVFIHEMTKFESPKIIETLIKHPITSICAAPTLYRSLVVAKDINKLHPSGEKQNSLQLRQCLSAGEPLNEEVIKKWNDITNIVIREGTPVYKCNKNDVNITIKTLILLQLERCM